MSWVRGERPGAHRISLVVVAALSIACFALAGCESLRLHDEGRLKVAQEAAATAAEFSAQGGAVFGPMEENLDKVKSTQARLRKLTSDHEYETFKVIAAGLTAEDVGGRLVDLMRDRIAAFDDLVGRERQAIKDVNAELDRQKLISAAITQDLEIGMAAAEKEGSQSRIDRLNQQLNLEQQIGERSLGQTLERVEIWLDWIDKGLQRFNQAQNALADLAGDSEIGGKVGTIFSELGDDAKKNAEILGGFVGDAQNAINQVQQNEQVQAAQQLLNATIQQTAAAEQERLVELRRHLAEIQRLRARLEVRDTVSVCKLYVRALGRIYFGVRDQQIKRDLVEITTALRQSGRYNIENGSSCLPTLSGTESNPGVAALWADDRLDAFVAKSLASDVQPRAAAELVGAIAILGFQERPIYEDARLDLAREQHRYSIRLSAINAGQRTQIVHQLAQGLAIYYAGGVKPEEVAQLLLLAAQVGGIFFIGAQL
jgi:hypothetical protein